MFKSAKLLRLTVLAISMFVLTACGGGGGGGDGGGGVVDGPYTVSGDISGHSNDVGIILNGGSPITVSPQDGTFIFTDQALTTGADYSIATVDPDGQVCIVTGSGAKIESSNITNINIECRNNTPGTFSVGGQVKGLTGTLSVFLALNNGTPIEVTSNTQFTFNDQLLGDGDGYSVEVTTQPATLDCDVEDSTGNILNNNITDIIVDCKIPTYSVGGKVSGNREDVVLTLNGSANSITIIPPGGDFTFVGQELNIDAAYSVEVTTPTGQTCSIDLGLNNGKIGRADVTDVEIVCDNIKYSIGGNITNVNSGSSIGLTLNNGTEFVIATDTLLSNTEFTMPTTVDIENDYKYSVKVKTPPVGQTCNVSGGGINNNGTGFASADVTDIAIACTNIPYSVGGQVSGLNAGTSINLTLNIGTGTGTAFNVKANDPATTPSLFTFPNQTITIGQIYNVVAVNPPGQSCVVNPGVNDGSRPAGNISDISVVCTNNGYTVGGTAGTFAATGNGADVLKLSLNGGPDLTVTPGATFTFPNQTLTIGMTYDVKVTNSPSGPPLLECSLTNGFGEIETSNIANVSVSCSDVVHKIGGNVSNLKGSLMLLNNNSDQLNVTPVANVDPTNFQFANLIGEGLTYNVSIATQPPGQICELTPGTETGTALVATFPTKIIDTVRLTCVDVYDVNVDVSNLMPGGIITLLNGGVEFPISTNGLSDIVTGLLVNDPYDVTFRVTPSGQPDGQTCTLTPNAAGPTIGAANETISVVCSNNPYTVGGTITSTLTGNLSLILSQNTVDLNAVTFTLTGRFDFPAATHSLVIDDNYEIRIATQPGAETCFVDPVTAKGKISTANVTDIAIECIDNTLDADNDGRPDAQEKLSCPSPEIDPFCSLRGNPDTDDDKVRDGDDAFPNDFDVSVDTDGDKIGNFFDDDDDGDGVDDVNDFFPLDGTRFKKTVLKLSLLKGNNGFKINGIDIDDFSGASVSRADVNGDGITDLIIGAYGANGDNSIGVDKKPNPGETYVIFGKNNLDPWPASFELSTLDGSNGFIIKGNRGNDRSGISVSGLGDINGDGIADFMIGAAEADTDSVTVEYAIKDAGKSYVVYGRTNWVDTPILSLEPSTFPNDPAKPGIKFGFILNGVAANDLSGRAVKNAGDINNDGVSDIIIGARGKLTENTMGFSYLLFGRKKTDTAWPDNFDLSSLASGTGAEGFVINGITEGDFSGWAVSGAGDVNGDMFDDLLIGARNATAAGVVTAGETYVIFGRDVGVAWSPSFNLSTLATGGGVEGFVIQGITVDDQSGSSVSAAGDINGDTLGDILIGAQKSDPNGNATAGESYILFGRPSGTPWPATFKLSSLKTIDGIAVNGFIIEGIASNDQNGIAVSGVNDINGDGIDDFITSASLADVNSFMDAGETYVIFGRQSGSQWDDVLNLSALSTPSADGTIGFVVRGIDMADNSGIAVSSAGDVNDDGFNDFIIGASKASPNGSQSGESYVIYGCDYFTATNLCITNLSKQ